jgi:hypothetical protein
VYTIQQQRYDLGDKHMALVPVTKHEKSNEKIDTWHQTYLLRRKHLIQILIKPRATRATETFHDSGGMTSRCDQRRRIASEGPGML